MTGKSIRFIALACALMLAACGTVATPVPQATERGAEATEAALPTEIVAAPTEAETVEAEPTETTAPSTATTVLPTATDIPPTETPAPTNPPAAATTEAAAETEAAAVEGDPAAGEQLFTAGANGGIPCSTCHHADSPDTLVGPGLAGIAERAGERVPGETALEYLHQSIVEPDAHVVEGFPAGVMPKNYGEIYSEEQIGDLIAYLMTLE